MNSFRRLRSGFRLCFAGVLALALFTTACSGGTDVTAEVDAAVAATVEAVRSIDEAVAATVEANQGSQPAPTATAVPTATPLPAATPVPTATPRPIIPGIGPASRIPIPKYEDLSAGQQAFSDQFDVLFPAIEELQDLDEFFDRINPELLGQLEGDLVKYRKGGYPQDLIDLTEERVVRLDR